MRAAILFLLASLTSGANAASSLEVAPTTLELKAGEPGLLYVANRSNAPTTVQIDIYDWKQSQNTDHLALSDTAFVSPPLAAIAPGERQIVRVLAQPKQSTSEAAYRLRVSELPDPSVKANGVQVLVQFSVPVFVRGSGNKDAVSWSAAAHGSGIEITAQNNSDRTLKLAGLALSWPGAAPLGIAPQSVVYILPGAAHVWSVDMPSVLPASARIAGTDERSGKSVAAELVIAR